ncbi:MAG: proton-conducting transporter membrane subunit, partial [Burkholderiales bacterium]
MEFLKYDLMPAAAEIFLLGAASVILLVDLFLPDEKRFVTYFLSQAALVATAVIAAATASGQVRYALNIMFVGDPMGEVLKVGVCLSVAVALSYSRAYLVPRGMYRGEFFLLALFATLGMLVMICANHFLVLYLGLELLSLSLYAMVALARDSARATEAAMKY